MKNKMTDLRDHLFATLEALQDEDKPMDIDRAKAIAEIAGKVVDTAKVEVEFLKHTGALKGTDFFPDEKPMVPQPQDHRRLRSA